MMQRIRVTYSRGEEFMYIGNLDMHKVWERIFRRADIKLAYSQGFHPQPRIHQACPLPLGFTSSDEILDFWLDSDESLAEVKEKIEKVMQPGISITQFENVPLNAPPLQTLVSAARYRITFDEPVELANVKQKLTKLMAKPTCLRERRGKQYDLLPLIKKIEVIDSPKSAIELTLVTLPGATGRPEEVLDELSIPITSVSIDRNELILEPAP
jgi:radical SAM-linked protein